MAKILFSVCGVGLGHASRSKTIIKELMKLHEVKIVSYGDAVNFLEKEFNEINKIYWFKLYYRKNQISKFKTILFNLPLLPSVLLKNYNKFKKIINEFKPDIIISDFDAVGITASKLFNLPSILISNLHAEKFFNPELTLIEKIEQKLSDGIILTFFPKPTHCIVASIIKPEKKIKNTYFFYSVINPEIIKMKSKQGKKILCYFGKEYFNKIIPLLKEFPEKKFVFYGKNVNEKINNIEFKKFSNKEWIKDISECNALLSHGGLLTLNEAIYLNKPIYVIATKQWFERLFNGLTIQKLGFGLLERIPTKTGLEKFFKNHKKYVKNLKNKKNKNENKELIKTINSLIEKEIKK
jgi:uncharacterized protein (TIGR00661 family)